MMMMMMIYICMCVCMCVCVCACVCVCVLVSEAKFFNVNIQTNVLIHSTLIIQSIKREICVRITQEKFYGLKQRILANRRITII